MNRAALCAAILAPCAVAACGPEPASREAAAPPAEAPWGYDLAPGANGDALAAGRCGAQGLALRFRAHAAEVELEGGEWLGLELERVGRGNALWDAPPVVAEPIVAGAEVRYGHGADLTEWYRNGPMGLEQGFELRGRPPGGMAPVGLAIATYGPLSPELRGASVALLDDHGARRAHYGKLRVTDADGVTIPSWLEVAGGSIVLRFDDTTARYPLMVDPLVWTLNAKLAAADAEEGDWFGTRVSLSGDTVLVGAHPKDNATGAAYAFVRDGGFWTQEQKLTASDAELGDQFGYSVSLSGDTALVGTQEFEVGAYRGSAYVFVRNSGVWTEQQKLTVDLSEEPEPLGVSASVSGDTALVSAGDGSGPSSVHVFVRSADVWSHQQKLTGPGGGSSGDFFGHSLSVFGDTAVMSAITDRLAYVFTRSGTVWTQQAALMATRGNGYDYFGGVVSLFADTVVVGAADDDDNGVDSGSAYVFVRSGTSWSVEAVLTPSGGEPDFGTSVSIFSDTALVGTSDSAYVFVRSGTTWTEQQKISVPSAPLDSLSVTSDTALFGVGFDDENGIDSGAAYVFQLHEVNDGDSCSDDSTCDSGFCVDGFCCASACGDGADDDCQACDIPGSEGTCSAVPSTTVCRPAAGDCDLPEACAGSADVCPADQHAADGTSCDSGTATCTMGTCEPIADDNDDDGASAKVTNGCTCRAARPPDRTPAFWLLALSLALTRARQRAPRSTASRR